MPQRRTVFFVSDGTGITAQMLGHSLLTQFEGMEFNQVTLPFVDSVDKAQDCLQRIEREALRGNGQPIVFSTLVNGDVREVVRRANALFVDFFEAFIGPLEGAAALYGAFAYGSRGLLWAGLGAELLASRMEGEPLPLEAPLAGALDPGRFALRARRRAGSPGSRP